LPDAAWTIRERLAGLGALYMRLEEAPGESAQSPGSRYFFSCRFADPQGPDGSRWFQGEGADPVSAMRQALFDVDRWQIVRQALLPAKETTQY
jgi:hypothetical protein